VNVELLYFDGCPSYERLKPRLEELMQRTGVSGALELHRVDSEQQAVHERFLGSPTVRVDGVDVDPGAAKRDDFGIKCRLYRDGERQHELPPDSWIVSALSR
jgi:hypothetical protein